MARYALREDLSFCHAGGRLVFLDIGSDRYLRLPPSLEATLVSYLSADCPADIDVSELLTRKILVDLPAGSSISRPTSKTPVRSAMEMPCRIRRIHILEMLEVFVVVLCTRLKLRLRPFRELLNELTINRQGSSSAAQTSQTLSEPRILEAAALFRRVRLYVPVGMRCLVDSVSLATFLRRRNIDTNVVFGVAVDPFSAHCWVQTGDLVLNDTLGNVTSHTPIRVV